MSDHNAAADGHSAASADHVEHPTWKQYRWVALWLVVITIVEVWVYYTPFKESSLFAPTLLIMSAVKFAIVVFYYMHLKYDNSLFKRLFAIGLGVAIVTLLALLTLFRLAKTAV